MTLIHSTSPYLLQHVHQPVMWYPWNEEVLDKAKKENKVIFLSVGYSTCHWCHVMAHECFENDRIAEILNYHFINIKVDREERPDLDALFMAMVQSIQGSGGWPMSIWLTPDLKPIYAGTYFPPQAKGGRVGFPDICMQIAKLWKDDAASMMVRADTWFEQIKRLVERDQETMEHQLKEWNVYGNELVEACLQVFDEEHGGFHDAPKFPRPALLDALLDYSVAMDVEQREWQVQAREMLVKTLDAMAQSGIYDHLAGGFHRYAVDARWRVPHFEKMLYDQAQLASLYLRAWLVEKKPLYRETAEQTLNYLIHELCDECGGFHTAEDADSLPSAKAMYPIEGAYWVWEAQLISQLLPAQQAAVFSMAYGIQHNGNVEDWLDPHDYFKGNNILHRAVSDEHLLMVFSLEQAELDELLYQAKEVLFEERKKRPLPHRDDKMIVAWNALAIQAMVQGYLILGKEEYLNAAVKAARFIHNNLWDGEHLKRSYRKQVSDAEAVPNDYAYLIQALIVLHAHDASEDWLAWAFKLQDTMNILFWDVSKGAFVTRVHLSAHESVSMIEDYDGAEPAATHVAALNLLAFTELFLKDDYAEQAKTILLKSKALSEGDAIKAPVLWKAADAYLRNMSVMHIPEHQAFVWQDYRPHLLMKPTAENHVMLCHRQTCQIISSS